MAYDFKQLKTNIAATHEWLVKEMSGIRTGRATPPLLDGVQVEAYGARMPISQVASLSTEDARTLRITPWDASQVKEIERAITLANLGVSSAVDDKGLRVFFPELTSERREQLLKISKQKLEEARVALRGERDKVWSDIQAKEKDGKLSEDEKFRAKDEMQKLVDEGNKKLEELAERKEKEISS